MLLDPTLTMAFIVFAGLLILSPGPDTLFVMASGMRHGSRGAVAAAFGGATGSLCHATAAAIGIGALIVASPIAFEFVRWAGAGYLLVLGTKALSSAWRNGMAGDAGRITQDAGSLRSVYRQGLVTSLLNPKMSAFYIAVLPQFADPKLGSIGLQMFLLGCLHNVLGTIYLIAIGSGAGRIAGILAANAGKRWLDGIAGGFFIGLAVRLMLQERPSR